MTEPILAEGTVLTQRQLNRILLARQYLLERIDTPVAEILEHLVGMQSQVPCDPYIGLWSRLTEFHPDNLSRLMLDRSAVRASLMRGTIHLVTADDFLFLRSLTFPLHARALRATDHGRKLDPELVPEMLDLGRELLTREPLTLKSLGGRLGQRWPDIPPVSMAQAIRFLLPLVQITPRGVWGASHQATWALAEQWIGRPIPLDSNPEQMVLRYLRAFGPATVADIATWSGVSGQRQVVERMRPQLRVFRNELGQELFDIPDGVITDQETPAPVRFLPGFENALLSHKDRTRIISEDRRKAIGSNNGLFQATYLVDGFVAGTWGIETTKERATLILRPFERHAAETIRELEAEGTKLISFVSGQSGQEVRIEDS
jgi:hypothetical protein